MDRKTLSNTGKRRTRFSVTGSYLLMLALCRWGLMFLPNLNSTLLKVHRSLVSGGRFVAAVWAYAHKVPVISLAMQIIGESVEMATESLPSVPNPFGLADKNRLSNSFLGAGFRDVGIETVTVTFEFSSGEDYSRYCQAIRYWRSYFFIY